MNAPRIIVLFGIWLITSLFFNETTNAGAIQFGINIRPDRLVYGLLVIEFLRQSRRSGSRVRWILEEKLMVLFFLILLVSCIVYGAISAPGNRYISKLFGFSIVPATLFMMSRRLSYDLRSLRLFWAFLIIIGFYLGFTGVCEHYHLDALVLPKYILDPSVGLHFGRVRGPFVSSVVMGGALIVIGLWIVWYHFSIRRTWLTWMALIPILGSIYWTETRSVWLQLATSLVLLVVFRNSLRKPIRILALLMVLVYFSGILSRFSAYDTMLFQQRREQVDDRLNIYHASWRMFLERPLFGFGYGNFLKYGDDYFEQLPGVELRGQGEGQHNTFLGLMCETGIVGTIPFSLVYCMLFITCYRRFRDAEPGDELGSSFAVTQFVILAGIAVCMQFSDFSFFNYINNLVFWLTAMAYARFEPMSDEAFQHVTESQAEALPKELMQPEVT